MRGGRNKFGPMYKRDRARRLQVMRQRQMLTIGGHGGGGAASPVGASATGSPFLVTSIGPGGHHYATTSDGHHGIKQELIQIPQLSSSTSSPDSSPLPGGGATLTTSHPGGGGGPHHLGHATTHPVGHPALIGHPPAAAIGSPAGRIIFDHLFYHLM